ncbi:hypothetical protein UY3_18222 [Chelonia mydas]|uniref:Uncharacterized protein n=1 Tax=Chelonia mydas TaxID=8469 RepID=M7APG8_CHEMY|nr:hypothetical protein UY3_18222 [Chelonia mydas]
MSLLFGSHVEPGQSEIPQCIAMEMSIWSGSLLTCNCAVQEKLPGNLATEDKTLNYD